MNFVPKRRADFFLNASADNVKLRKHEYEWGQAEHGNTRAESGGYTLVTVMTIMTLKGCL